MDNPLRESRRASRAWANQRMTLLAGSLRRRLGPGGRVTAHLAAGGDIGAVIALGEPPETYPSGL